MTQRILGTSRYLVVLAVVSTFVMSVILQAAGAIRVVAIVFDTLEAALAGESEIYKLLIVDAVGLIDLFLIGTVLFIIAAGLYQLFIDPDLPTPAWLQIHTLDDLKSRLTGVIVVGLLVAFLGVAIEWKGGTDIAAIGIAIAAVIAGVGVYYRLVGLHHEPRARHRAPSSAPSASDWPDRVADRP
jgi:uncharacterized membrane protein YqhA